LDWPYLRGKKGGTRHASNVALGSPCLTGLMRHDPDPQVRRRAHVLLPIAEGRLLGHVARLFHIMPPDLGRADVVPGARAGLRDASHPGHPPSSTTPTGDGGHPQVLEWLKKRATHVLEGCDCFTWTTVKSTSTFCLIVVLQPPSDNKC